MYAGNGMEALASFDQIMGRLGGVGRGFGVQDQIGMDDPIAEPGTFPLAIEVEAHGDLIDCELMEQALLAEGPQLVRQQARNIPGCVPLLQFGRLVIEDGQLLEGGEKRIVTQLGGREHRPDFLGEEVRFPVGGILRPAALQQPTTESSLLEASGMKGAGEGVH
jgi:hypothetical protein